MIRDAHDKNVGEIHRNEARDRKCILCKNDRKCTPRKWQENVCGGKMRAIKERPAEKGGSICCT